MIAAEPRVGEQRVIEFPCHLARFTFFGAAHDRLIVLPVDERHALWFPAAAQCSQRFTRDSQGSGTGLDRHTNLVSVRKGTFALRDVQIGLEREPSSFSVQELRQSARRKGKGFRRITANRICERLRQGVARPNSRKGLNGLEQVALPRRIGPKSTVRRGKDTSTWANDLKPFTVNRLSMADPRVSHHRKNVPSPSLITRRE